MALFEQYGTKLGTKLNTDLIENLDEPDWGDWCKPRLSLTSAKTPVVQLVQLRQYNTCYLQLATWTKLPSDYQQGRIPIVLALNNGLRSKTAPYGHDPHAQTTTWDKGQRRAIEDRPLGSSSCRTLSNVRKLQ
jgi:hypothetical protein